MKLSAVTVWYNPISLGENKAVENILSYSSVVEKIYIVDNSDCENEKLAKKISNAVYIPLMKNEGIAKALNVGCQLAMDDRFEWCMTMDQDSHWNSEELKKYLEKVEEKIAIYDDVKSFVPEKKYPINHSILGEIKSKLFQIIGRAEGEKVLPCEEEFCDREICSGNVIELETWKNIGGFLEELFIDEVDYEFCYRLIESGFKILKFSYIYLDHIGGTPMKKLIPIPVTDHFGKRLYYIFRNLMYVNYLHPQFGRKYFYSSQIEKRLFYNIIISPFIYGVKRWGGVPLDLIYFFKAKKDFKEMKRRKENEK